MKTLPRVFFSSSSHCAASPDIFKTFLKSCVSMTTPESKGRRIHLNFFNVSLPFSENNLGQLELEQASSTNMIFTKDLWAFQPDGRARHGRAKRRCGVPTRRFVTPTRCGGSCPCLLYQHQTFFPLLKRQLAEIKRIPESFHIVLS